MFGLVVVVTLITIVLLGTAIAGRYSVAPPVILLVIGGLLGLLPRFGGIRLDPEIVLVLFLPAILYWETLNTSLREIRANVRVIALSGVVLVLVTATTVSFTAQALGIDSRAAWVLGAVLAPTDAAAVAGLAKRLPRRTLTIVRAESLVNDGTALVLFAIAVSIAGSDAAFSLPGLVARFVGSYVGGVLAGLVVGAAVTLLRRRIDEPLLEGALSVLTPFAAFLLAQSVGASGVVAVVVAGLVLTQVGPRVIRARSRIQAFAFWDLATFLLNGCLFVFVGVQIPGAVHGIANIGSGVGRAVLVALAVTGVVVGTRIAWVEISTLVIRAVDRRAVQRSRRVGWRQRFVTSWAGFRGAVSLATALAVPATTPSGEAFPDRNLIVFVTSVVILLTILGQGTTLPAVIRWARFPADTARADELQLARTHSARVAIDALPGVAADIGLDDEVVEHLRTEYEQHAAVIDASADTSGDTEVTEVTEVDEAIRRVRLAVLARKRLAVTELRDENRIDDIVLREL